MAQAAIAEKIETDPVATRVAEIREILQGRSSGSYGTDWEDLLRLFSSRYGVWMTDKTPDILLKQYGAQAPAGYEAPNYITHGLALACRPEGDLHAQLSLQDKYLLDLHIQTKAEEAMTKLARAEQGTGTRTSDENLHKAVWDAAEKIASASKECTMEYHR